MPPTRLNGVGKYHGPGYVADPSPQFPANEVADPAQAKADRYKGCDKICHLPERSSCSPAKPPHGHDHTDQTAMKRHASLSDLEKEHGILTEAVQTIEKYVTKASAQYHSNHAVEQDVSHFLR